MSVGSQPSEGQINSNLTSLALQLRTLMRQVAEQQQYVVQLGLTGLEGLGFGSAANPANPGGVSDAQAVLNYFSNMNTVAGVYFGTVQQGGNGGTGASLFNFDNALCALWSGQ